VSRRPLLFARALMLRCPNCGERGVVRRWLQVAEDCPSCAISLVRGNRVGAYILNLGAAEVVVIAVVLTLVVRGWPDHVPWDLLGWLAPLLAVASPLVFYPFSRMGFVAIDLAMHPETRRDEDVGRETRDERR
jgi:uncharacterized protein (DUF983 family)